MNRRILVGVAVVLAAVILGGVVGVAAYRAGVMQGLAQAGGGVPMPYAYGPFWHHGPFPFFGLGFLVFPLLFLLLFVMARRLGWGPRCGGWHHESLDEWHRRAHEPAPGRGEKA
jgi:hypothetical protein